MLKIEGVGRMRVSVCVGNYAKTPYCMPGLEIYVYSMEELCYCMRENAFLLDISLMDDELLGWIERECGLRELARILAPMVHRQGSLSAFVSAILRYVGFFGEEVRLEVEQTLKRGAGLSGMEKRKNQLDYLVKKKKYRQALRGYDELLDKWRTDEGTQAQDTSLAAPDFLARIWHNKGVAYGGLMLYEAAAECFRRAFELGRNEEYCVDYLAAKRMELSEDDYVAFASEREEWYPSALAVEKKLEMAMEEWEQQPDYLRLCNRAALRGSDRLGFYEDSERLTRALEDGYRQGM